MKKLKLGVKELNIKNESLKRIVSAALSCREITREAVSQKASVSFSNAGKVLSALDECGFTEIEYRRDKRVGPPIGQHVFRHGLSVLVLDLSSPIYSAHICSGNAERIISEKHTYDPALSFENNVIMLLSNVGLKISKQEYSLSAICTVIADEQNVASTRTETAFLPKRTDMMPLNSYCARFFGIMPSLCLTLSEAITCAVKYGVLGSLAESHVGFITLSDSINALYIAKSSPAILLQTNMLMADNVSKLSDLAKNARNIKDTANIIARAVNFISCAYPVNTFWVETDLNRFPSLDSCVDSVFKSFEITPPIIRYVDAQPPTAILGAASEIMCHFICSHLRGK